MRPLVTLPSRFQNPLSARVCGFESHLRYPLELKGISALGRSPRARLATPRPPDRSIRCAAVVASSRFAVPRGWSTSLASRTASRWGSAEPHLLADRTAVSTQGDGDSSRLSAAESALFMRSGNWHSQRYLGSPGVCVDGPRVPGESSPRGTFYLGGRRAPPPGSPLGLLERHRLGRLGRLGRPLRHLVDSGSRREPRRHHERRHRREIGRAHV